MAFFNTHLDYVKYGPKLLLDGMPMDEVLASEDEVRTDSIRIQTPDMQELSAAGYPVFLTGDFNQPSSLDYAEETVGTREGITEPVPWTVSEALFDVGMRDTFREIHTDPVENPGITKDNPDFRSGGFGDRIDYVYAGGPVTTLDSKLVGETGGPDVDLEYDPWTSDHRAVLSTFELAPVALPTTVSLDRRLLTEGEDLGVLYNAPSRRQHDCHRSRRRHGRRGLRIDHRWREGHDLLQHRRPRAVRVRNRHGGRRRHGAGTQCVLGEITGGGRRPVDRSVVLRSR